MHFHHQIYFCLATRRKVDKMCPASLHPGYNSHTGDKHHYLHLACPSVLWIFVVRHYSERAVSVGRLMEGHQVKSLSIFSGSRCSLSWIFLLPFGGCCVELLRPLLFVVAVKLWCASNQAFLCEIYYPDWLAFQHWGLLFSAIENALHNCVHIPFLFSQKGGEVYFWSRWQNFFQAVQFFFKVRRGWPWCW